MSGVTFEEKASGQSLVIPAPSGDALVGLLERFAGETFGARAGALLATGDPAVESELAERGVDAYHTAFRIISSARSVISRHGFLTLAHRKIVDE